MVKRYFKNLLTVYETTKVVGVKSPIVAVVHILLVTLVWCSFLISLHLDIRKIYQKTCPVHGVVLTKVKGFASTENLSDEELSVPNAEFYRRTWDPNDLVWPEQGGEGETGSFAIVTNLIITPNQTLSTCADKQGSFKCSEDSDCTQGYWSPATNGVHTGHCEYDDGTCQITGWCPPENRDLPRNGKRALLEGVENFTVLLKNTVEFPGCSDPYQMRNLPNQVNKDYLKHCRYDADKDPLCPIFRIGDIVKWSGDNFTQVAIKGGVFRIKLVWDCDLDFGKTIRDCQPTYRFMRVDDREVGIFNGWNFRHVIFYSATQRILLKEYALKILIDLEGEGSKFDFFQLVIKFGATIGLFSVASLACNLLLGILERAKKASCLEILCRSHTFEVAGNYSNTSNVPTQLSVQSETNKCHEEKPSKENFSDNDLDGCYYINKTFI